jgi:hypothetical protein
VLSVRSGDRTAEGGLERSVGYPLIPAKAGIQESKSHTWPTRRWVPASAGTSGHAALRANPSRDNQFNQCYRASHTIVIGAAVPADDKPEREPYIPARMFRRALTILVILSLAAFGYRPAAAGMMPAAEPAAVAMAEPMAMPDCPGAMAASDCCDETDGQKQNCAWDAACAARCHVNACAEPVTYLPSVVLKAAEAFAIGELRAPVPERRGTLYRPPII